MEDQPKLAITFIPITLRITTLSIIDFIVKLSIIDSEHYDIQHNHAECCFFHCYAEWSFALAAMKMKLNLKNQILNLKNSYKSVCFLKLQSPCFYTYKCLTECCIVYCLKDIQTQTHTQANTHTHTHTHIYTCVCRCVWVCGCGRVCVSVFESVYLLSSTCIYTHTYIHYIYIYTYIYIYNHVCVCVCDCVSPLKITVNSNTFI